jgi:LPXTG-motif cell wall-anchored protein
VNKNSNTGVYIVIGISVVGLGGYFIFKKWYDDKVKSNPAFSMYNWFQNTIK